jgi:hypothetical protein
MCQHPHFSLSIAFILSLAAAAPVLAGCSSSVHVYQPMAHHTLKASADTENDVLWVQRLDGSANRGTLFRCTSTAQGPRCVEAKAP